ncbi:hypothetical protein J1N35_018656 [Gossypium stocksii]|uniref:Uncharacterized protein n=1 Tax=Gossypium stocksii TaxID=47602 RepID=A0A9D3VQ61_9ROSI|nr:hypothetical protein J1N35_018656 [Gossypium stocksii]
MTYETPKQTWDKLKEEFHRTKKTRQQKLLNLRIISIVNNIRLLGDQFNDQRYVEKVITTLLEKYESKISSLEDSRDLTTISLSELINAIYTEEQKRASRDKGYAKGAYQARNNESLCSSSNKGKKK